MMSNTWIFEVNIKDIINADLENTSIEHAMWVAHQIANELRKGLPKIWLDVESYGYDYWIHEIVDVLECFGDDELDDYKFLNQWLTELYDWADENRIWLGS